jgi:hypothetical protein
MEAHPDKFIDGKKEKDHFEKLGRTRIGEDTVTRKAVTSKLKFMFKKTFDTELSKMLDAEEREKYRLDELVMPEV